MILWSCCFLWIWGARPNGANVMRLKLCGPLRYAYADLFTVSFSCCRRFTCISICGMSLSHRYSGNVLSTPHRTDFKCPLNVCIHFRSDFYSAFQTVLTHIVPHSLLLFLCTHMIFHYWGYVSLD